MAEEWTLLTPNAVESDWNYIIVGNDLDKISEDANTPDDQWIEYTNKNSISYVRLEFDPYVGTPDLTVDFVFMIVLRQGAGGSRDPEVDFQWRYGGAPVKVDNQPLTSGASVLYRYDVPYAEIGPPDTSLWDPSKIDLKISIAPQGTNPQKKNGDIGAVNWWIKNYIPPPPPGDGYTDKPKKSSSYKNKTRKSSSWTAKGRDTSVWTDKAVGASAWTDKSQATTTWENK